MEVQLPFSSTWIVWAISESFFIQYRTFSIGYDNTIQNWLINELSISKLFPSDRQIPFSYNTQWYVCQNEEEFAFPEFFFLSSMKRFRPVRVPP